MAKPTDLAVWNTDASNRTVPAAPQKATGWTFKQKAISAYFNWWMNAVYQWIAWLDAGAWTAVSLVLSGALTAASAVFSVTVTSPRFLFTTSKTKRIPLTLIADNGAANSCTTHTRTFGNIVLAISTTPLYAPIEMNAAEVITAYAIGLAKNDASFSVTSKIVSLLDGVETNESVGASSGTGTGSLSLGESGISLQGGKNYYIKITPGGANTPGNDHIKSASFSYNEPV